MTLSEVTLNQWIAFTQSLSDLDKALRVINNIPDGKRKEILITQNHINRAISWAEFFNIDFEYVDDALKAWNDFNQQFAEIKPPCVVDIALIKFGQFIDAKMITSDASRNQWELLQYIMVIFRLEYKPEMLNESSPEFKNAGENSIDVAYGVMLWFTELNETINSAYTLFQESGQDEGEHMKEHMRRWGWVNFLKSIAKTKVFDISGSGMNSIDCARAASLDDVLVWASEEKEYNIAMSLDIENRS